MALIQQAQQTAGSGQLLIPSASVCYPMHGDFVPRNATQPTLALATGATGNWNAQGYYAFPAGNTTDVANSDNSITLDSVLSTVGMQPGNQWIIAHEQTTPNHSGTGFVWCYGNDGSSQSFIAMAMISTEVFQFQFRGVGASVATTHQFVMSSLPLTGKRCSVVLSIEAQSQTTVIVRALARTLDSDAAWLDLGASGVLDLRANSATANPGRATVNHAGLTIGARPTTGWTPAGKATIGNYASLFGNGSGNGRVGNLCARKFGTTDAARLQAVADSLWAKPREYPEAML
jgi:hypothetical protein